MRRNRPLFVTTSPHDVLLVRGDCAHRLYTAYERAPGLVYAGVDEDHAAPYDAVHPDARAFVLLRRDRVPRTPTVIELWLTLPAPPLDVALQQALRCLGVTKLHPITCARTHARRDRDSMARLQLPAPVTLAAALETEPCVLLRDAPTPLGAIPSAAVGHRPRALLLGPEGGFTPEELVMIAAAGLPTAHLGSDTLRIETAALAAAATLCGATIVT